VTPRAPLSTYRIQLTPEFGLDDAAGITGYLADLGVSHVYCSPYLQASPGSTHGYDVVDHGKVNDELGGADAHARFVAACHEAGLGVVLDIVPNHMSVAEPESANAAWWSVLSEGPASPYAAWFDIDWGSLDNPGRVLLPVLGGSLQQCLAAGEIELTGDRIRYYDHEAPLAPGTEHLVLPEVLDAQHWRLCDWRVAAEELNYRRFFDVTTLAGVRVEDPDVFDATHREVLRQIRAGELDGLRIDHPDGLADPEGYLDRLSVATGGAWVVVEKILEDGEHLPAGWACAGTTGYDALNRLLGLFVDPAGAEPLTTLYGELTSEPTDWHAVEGAAKRYAVQHVLSAELNRLTELVVRAAWAERATRDLTRRGLREAFEAMLGGFDVYRAYLVPGRPADPVSVETVTRARARALESAPARAAEIDAVCRLVVAGPPELVVRFQQTCGPVMAKGLEDTAFYRYNRLVALNEVGGAPAVLGRSVGEFHAAAAAAQRDWPLSMTALSTHDTKRAEDVRARLAVLSEDPVGWGRTAARLLGLGEKHAGPAGPDRNACYLLLQTLVGAWPIDVERAQRYLEKATREAKQHTSWTAPNGPYDEALAAYVAGVLGDEAFVSALRSYVDTLLDPGRVVSLAQKLLQLTMPGVPDVYQGSELWDHSLVDPDNRRPVDYGERARLLATTRGTPKVDGTGAAKLHVVRAALTARRDHPDAFGHEAGYEPLAARGAAAEHVVAFARSSPAAPSPTASQLVTVVPRLVLGLGRAGGWKDTSVPLPDGSWTDVLTGRRHDGGEAYLLRLLRDFPVALLVRD